MATSWHLTSLTVLGGTLHGKKLAIEDVVVEALVGSDPDCHLHLDLPTISPIHARLWIEPDDVTVYGTQSGPGVFVNFDRVEGDAKLRPGDMLWLGPPQAAGSVLLRAQFEERDTLPPVAVSPLADEEPSRAGAEPEPLVLEPTALSDPLPIAVPTWVEPEAEAEAKASAESQEEALGVLPEPVSEPSPPASFDDFLIMDSAGSPPVRPPASVDEFVVAGFEADWPEVPEPPAPFPPPAEDAFFVDLVGQSPPVGAVSESDDSFFIDDGSLGSAPVTRPAPIPSQARELGADHEDLSFAAAFLEEAAPRAPIPSKPVAPLTHPAPPTPPPVTKQAAPAPPVRKTAPAPVAPTAAPPRAGASVPQAVPPAPVPPRSPTATGGVRPLPRPEVSSSASRGDRPPTPRPERSQPVRAPRRAAQPIGRYAVIGAVTLAVLGGIGFAVSTLLRRVRLERVEPQRARVGDTLALVGRGFATSPGDNVVLFDDKPAQVSTATSGRLEVVVPDVATADGDVRTVVRVRVGRAESLPVEISVFAGPVLHGISPDVAMPGDEVVLAGSGWGLGPTVRFGGLSAEVLEARETSIRVRVPAVEGGPGTAAPVAVTSGALDSNPGPFYLGRIPLVTRADPTTVSPGDVVTLSGRGFRRERSQNAAQVGGLKALVVSAFDSEIKVVVPRVPAGSRMLEVRVPSSVAPAQVPLVVGATDAAQFRFVAEPFDALPGRDHAVLATALGPAFVLASSGGRSSAERALEASRRLNEAAQPLKASSELNFDLRDADSKPSLGLVGRPEILIEVTDEDAAAYGEDWTGLRGRGGPVTPGRLGRWWEAVAKDLVLLLVRGERPHFAADLAPEGRVLVDLFQTVQRSGSDAQAKPPPRDALRVLALRVPPGVRGPTVVAPVSLPSSTAPATPAPPAAQPMPRLDGAWTGTESEGGRQRDVTVTFRGSTGTIAYEGVMTVSAPLLSVDQPQRGGARFSVELRGGLRHYLGRWDGQALAGKISTDPGGSQSLGTFELRPR
jgi:FHA domain/IPT/TIG domain